MVTVEEAATILRNPKDYWSHEVADAQATANRITMLLGCQLRNSREVQAINYKLNYYLRKEDEERCSMSITATTKSTCE